MSDETGPGEFSVPQMGGIVVGISTPGVSRFDLVEGIRLMWRRKWLLLMGGFAGAVLAGAFSLILTPRYQAVGNMVVRSDALTSSDNEKAFYSSAVNEAVVTTEQEILTSEGLLRRVAEQVEIPAALLTDKSLMQRGIELLDRIGMPESALEAELHRLFPAPDLLSPNALAARRTRFVANSLTIVTTKNSSVISVRATTYDPQLSSAIVNSVMEFYMQERSAERSHTARLIEDALRQRLRQTQRQIDEGEQRLVQMQQRPGGIENSDIPGQMRDMTLLSEQLTQAKAELARRQADYNAALQTRDSKGEIPLDADSIGGQLRRQLAELQANLAETSASKGPNYPGRQAQQHEIEALQGEIATETSRGIALRNSRLAAAVATVNALEQQLSGVRRQRLQQISSTIGLDGQRETVASLRRVSNALEARLVDVAAMPASPDARILTAAEPPIRPAFPSKTMFVMAGFLLAGVASVASLLLATHIRRLRPIPLQLARQMNAPLLGGLPRITKSRNMQRRLLGSAIVGNSEDGLAETLHAVALELEDAIKEGQLRCVMVTSGHNGEGKTTVATALSRSLAVMSMRVLLFDLDLRRPSAERMFLSSAPDVLEPGTQQIDPQNVLQVLRDRSSGLHIATPFPAGCDDPIGYLRSAALRETVELLRNCYDLLVFDTPPILSVPDALVAAKLSDAIVLVSALGRSNEAEAAEISRRLAGTRRPLCGVVVTKVVGNTSLGTYSGYASPRMARSRRQGRDGAFKPTAQA